MKHHIKRSLLLAALAALSVANTPPIAAQSSFFDSRGTSSSQFADIQGSIENQKSAEAVRVEELRKNSAFLGLDGKPAREDVIDDYRRYSDVSYGAGDSENVLDIYIPRGSVGEKVIVYIHGSGWTGGDKAEVAGSRLVVDEFVGRRKYALVSINYRLVKNGKNIFPAQLDDIRAALDFLAGKAAQYHYDGGEFALMGGSAGGHLAMLYAYGYDPEKRIKTVVDFWGPTDLADAAVWATNAKARATMENFLGVSDPRAQICRDASPYYRLTKETGVPTILFHGGEDPLVPAQQAEKLYEKLMSLGIPAQYELYPHEKHGIRGWRLLHVLWNTFSWLDQYYPSDARAAEASGRAGH